MNNTFLIQENYTIEGVTIKIVRDDIFPFVGGGSKARKAVAYEKFLKKGGYNAIVTCGGIQSNHNRAMALMCAKYGWKCHLCIQGTEERFLSEKGNALLDRLSGAECELIKPEDTAVAMGRAMEDLKTRGFKPYYVIGGGHNLPGGTCFVEAVQELKGQCDDEGYKPECLFLASGTGSTHAGIQVGLDLVGWSDVKCIGISVARQQKYGAQVVAEFANMLAEYYGIDKDYKSKILFNSDYLYGGYENFTLEMKEYLEDVMKHTGLVFDLTYSGKALYGMMNEIKKNHLEKKNIIFWHTGGIMNIMK
ncbi:1-aminocyclopropane-1-carboxylate deaminase/D-cysteine desulfhydrase [Bacteroides pyogenes]|uniref:1-aminocyclopropane-1-carboxylate deaminase/D-cysteine desulfhydrase n=1 Tax=Bacteroides pyogenes TaxID=310300 RepID=UPI001BA94E6B|nr:pyridoxal-phosphate dependent enzyme [Bacteroides pyogenes]MBR8709117.1 D-cysteine desulfhydrase [Bacteroides pyogenes]MBR8717976.1 D-cysteine desulfhydrase [Bacteroides pyogenes]MBR8747409.1 D-cysteine desulfhydrase [Bacteroides pyogenes]MBR8757762.1 D-cysteine desulfhydrase [Bacteroides pyogenes]MBR8780978.1 D-cysteine desulfhydrase [Bacteroides pyogenes]